MDRLNQDWILPCPYEFVHSDPILIEALVRKGLNKSVEEFLEEIKSVIRKMDIA